MIQRVDIKNFGSFSNFIWANQVKKDGQPVDFKKLNILYGRNYSGKTTLSRLVRCLETGALPSKFQNPDFSIKTDAGLISPASLGSQGLHVRVFNKDFVDEHLSFLRNEDGDIEPFAVLGGDNTKIEKEIAEKEKNLGSVESKTGFRHVHAEKQAKWVQKVTARDKATSDRTQTLRNKANQDIKQSPHLYGDVINYNIQKIESDIQVVQKKGISPLSDEEEVELRSLLRQEALPAIAPLVPLEPNLQTLHSSAVEILGREIKPTKPIQDLLDDALLQAWVKQGIPLHRDSRETCGFCGSPLPRDLWEKIDQHFSKESQALDTELSGLLAKINAEADRMKKIVPFGKPEIYPALHKDFVEIDRDIQTHLKEYLAELKWLADEVESRQADPFKARKIGDLADSQSKLEAAFARLEPLLEKQLQKTNGLSSEQNSAQKKLLLSAISSFIATIDLPKIDKDIATLSGEVIALQTEVTSAQKHVALEVAAIEDLRKQLRDERRGAEKVNNLLTHYFGHGSLKLVAIDTGVGPEAGVRFEILRGEAKAYNLSDGECSLIAFCYFMAKLQGADSEGKDLIIYIDDPVSSLDGNHVFFVYGLIESLIARAVTDGSGNKTYRYMQLFISTHSLEFLKFLKKLSKPKKNHEQFVVIRKKDLSDIELMPDYLRNYVTEFHFLFDEICECLDSANATKSHHSFYNFGNNLRKFLEVFLFFKFPFSSDDGDGNKRLDKYFEGDDPARELVNRLTNEYSHLGGVIDRGIQPVDCDEISKVAEHVLKKMKFDDGVQFADLLSAVGRADPFVPR
ncbi:MAG: AAA family ATPase [Luteolibacter sp.]|jgi:wobble nucleotide-excising tRNase|nr:AAA family ATPase [Luteolibacter sp.]